MFGRIRPLINAVAVATAVIGGVTSSAFALPWDTDLWYQQSYMPGEIARSPVPGTVPLGQRPFTATLDEAEKLTNSSTFNFDSVWRGRRLYSANCLVCHGRTGDAHSVVGPQVNAPSLIDDLRKSRSDGRIFWVIQNGQGAMPRYGYKLSAGEKWDIINYVRYLQGRNVPGMVREAAK